MADPNLTRRRSYNQSKCLYLWFTDRLVFYERRKRKEKVTNANYRKCRKKPIVTSAVSVILLSVTWILTVGVN